MGLGLAMGDHAADACILGRSAIAANLNTVGGTARNFVALEDEHAVTCTECYGTRVRSSVLRRRGAPFWNSQWRSLRYFVHDVNDARKFRVTVGLVFAAATADGPRGVTGNPRFRFAKRQLEVVVFMAGPLSTFLLQARPSRRVLLPEQQRPSHLDGRVVAGCLRLDEQLRCFLVQVKDDIFTDDMLERLDVNIDDE